MKTNTILIVVLVVGLSAAAYFLLSNKPKNSGGVGDKSNPIPPQIAPSTVKPSSGMNYTQAVAVGASAACAAYFGDPSYAPVCGAAAPMVIDGAKSIWNKIF